MIDLGAGLAALDLLMVEGPRDVFALGFCEGSYSWGKFPAVEIPSFSPEMGDLRMYL